MNRYYTILIVFTIALLMLSVSSLFRSCETYRDESILKSSGAEYYTTWAGSDIGLKIYEYSGVDLFGSRRIMDVSLFPDNLTDDQIVKLSLTHVVDFKATSNRISKALSNKIMACKNIRFLYLDIPGLDNGVIYDIAQSRNVSVLTIRNSSVNDMATPAIIKMSGLTVLAISGSSISDKGAEDIILMHPRLQIELDSSQVNDRILNLSRKHLADVVLVTNLVPSEK